MDPFIGQIIMFGGNFAPRGWAFCNGQLLSISQNTALFSILGTTYGGDGRVSFALPEMRGRVPMHEGTGPGLTPRSLGQKAGQQESFLTVANMPSHNHTAATTTQIAASSEQGEEQNVNGQFIASHPDAFNEDPSGSVTLGGPTSTTTVGNNGQNQSFNNLPPYQAVNFIICLQGLFPSRN